MPQIVCSQHAVDPRSVVIGDRALLSAAEGACATETCTLTRVYFHACVCLCVKGSINGYIRQCCCWLQHTFVFVQYVFADSLLPKTKHLQHLF